MNVIVIMNGTWRYDCLGVNGNDVIHTPVLDQFASESAVFERSYAGSYPTVPIRHDLQKGRFGAPFHGWLPLECVDVARSDTTERVRLDVDRQHASPDQLRLRIRPAVPRPGDDSRR